MNTKAEKTIPIPKHLKIRLPFSVPQNLEENRALQVRKYVQEGGLHTVCQEAACPNLGHCWSQGTATFMISGDLCTRRCGFCNVKTGRPLPLDEKEPEKLAEAVFQMQLKHVVITSVDRDELKDCGSAHFAQSIQAVRGKNPYTRIEALIPDFKAKIENLERIWEARPDIINHNVETVPSLYKSVCPQSSYKNSLEVLKLSSEKKFLTKSGIILGLGEGYREVCRVIKDLLFCGVKMLTIGQYLQPNGEHFPMKEYVPLPVFRRLKEYALKQGMAYVESGPLVRSSFHAQESFSAYLKTIL